MDEEQLIKLMNDNGFTKMEVGKLLLAAKKYPATLGWQVREFARLFKSFMLTLLIVSAIFCILTFSTHSDIVMKLCMFSVYILVMFVAYKIHALNYMFKCHQFMKVIK